MSTAQTIEIPPVSEKDADFQPEEWLALFPAPSPPVPTFGDEPQSACPDDAARAADPLTPDGILRDFTGMASAAAWPALRVCAALPPWILPTGLAVCGAASVALLGVSITFAGDQFEAEDYALGIVGVAFFFGWGAVTFALASGGPRKQHPPQRSPDTLSASPVVRHVPGDISCRCGSCCRWAGRGSWLLSFLDFAVNTAIAWTAFFFIGYTPVVSYRSSLWSTWYGILLGTIWAALFPFYAILAYVRVLHIDNVARAALERRLHCRAVDIAMGDLLGRFRRAAAAGDPPPRTDSWLYVRLHYRFAALCRFRRQQDSVVISRLYGLIFVPGHVLFIALFVAVGRCIAAWQLALVAHAALYFTVNAVDLASRNQLIDAVAAVYRDAQRELRALALRAGPGPLAAELELHDRAVASFLDVAHYRARLFGFVVSFGTVRTMLVTGLTVAVALWSVLRAFGETVKWDLKAGMGRSLGEEESILVGKNIANVPLLGKPGNLGPSHMLRRVYRPRHRPARKQRSLALTPPEMAAISPLLLLRAAHRAPNCTARGVVEASYARRGLSAASETTDCDVVVLGAGVAGLSAAQRLRTTICAEKGAPRVAVLEARTRVLGRLLSADAPSHAGGGKAAPPRIDLGAQWLRVDKARRSAVEDWLGFAGVAFKEWKSSERAVAGFQPNAETAHDGSNEPVQKLRTALADHSVTNILFPGGMAEAFAPLAEGVDVRFGEHVSRIELADGRRRKGARRLRVVSDTGSVFAADWAVCSLPLPVLRDVAFHPSLPAAVQEALSPSLRPSRYLDKLVVTLPGSSKLLDRLFQGAESVRVATPSSGAFTLVDLRVWDPAAEGVVAFVTGETALRLADTDAGDVSEFALAVLSSAFAASGLGALPHIVRMGSLRTRWSRDPFARGSFTAFAGPPASYTPIPDLRSPDGEAYLFFAGEHTPPASLDGPAADAVGAGGDGSKLVGTLQGAWASGTRAADEIAREWVFRPGKADDDDDSGEPKARLVRPQDDDDDDDDGA
ncbi:hypothetical protein DFJ74DRAFT_647713 [Hyaloraphidium curvatum]|nr:hypothetical protein DFJ74DRAFT_647713 [Hyaloraphidium curvatum]